MLLSLNGYSLQLIFCSLPGGFYRFRSDQSMYSTASKLITPIIAPPETSETILDSISAEQVRFKIAKHMYFADDFLAM